MSRKFTARTLWRDGYFSSNMFKDDLSYTYKTENIIKGGFT